MLVAATPSRETAPAQWASVPVQGPLRSMEFQNISSANAFQHILLRLESHLGPLMAQASRLSLVSPVPRKASPTVILTLEVVHRSTLTTPSASSGSLPMPWS